MTQMNPTLAQPAKYDGVYAGLQTLTEKSSANNYSKCLKGPFKRKLVIKDGTATYVFNPTYQGQVTGSVGEGGDVAATDPAATGGGVSLAGKIQGDEFAGEIWSLYCTYSLQLTRVPDNGGHSLAR